ncbi:uncharacterized protein LOC118191946 [Stegodyphus dumicola]|uniref:uncharacterized protein LOC118191946 n=1 Tax=Stegodyphus dumicola TaxID=202533 RepID=UPI0015ACBCBF|nr:uncharacterized protein LOC118191946 [Stegodyphus dumicola]
MRFPVTDAYCSLQKCTSMIQKKMRMLQRHIIWMKWWHVSKGHLCKLAKIVPFKASMNPWLNSKVVSSLKQYLPLKPIKRGIKVWERCDAATGYTYDFNIYSGKEDMDNTDHEGTILGERVVLKLSSTIRNPDVTLTFDRFFTSVNLLDNISFPSVGTCISRRKDMPKFSDEKLQKGDSEFLQNRRGTLAARWQDSKEVLISE